jgi:uncharacterized membrane protein YhiD involved in acid resistance
MFECTMLKHLVLSAFCGAVVGWERNSRSTTKPRSKEFERQNATQIHGRKVAGIRTLALISLGSCAFTEASLYAFMDHPRTEIYDSSRVAAQVCSGVGFLGGGVLIKTGVDVRGLTTAASIWLCAAVGMMMGGDLMFMSCFLTAVAILVLRLNRGFVYNEDIKYGLELPVLPSSRSSTPPMNL